MQLHRNSCQPSELSCGSLRFLHLRFTQINPAVAQDAESGFRMHDDNDALLCAGSALTPGTLPSAKLAGASDAADAAAVAERLRSKFCLVVRTKPTCALVFILASEICIKGSFGGLCLVQFPSDENTSCRFMRTEPLEEVMPLLCEKAPTVMFLAGAG